MGNRAASRLVMVSGISEEFWGGKKRTRVGYGDLCCALVPDRPYRDPAGLRGSTAVALGRRIPAAGPLWSPELGLRHRQNPGREKQTCIHPSRGCSSSLRFSSREGSGAAPPSTAFFPFPPSAEPGPWRLVPARPHLCTPYGHLDPSATALPPAPRSSPRCWDAPSPPRGSPSEDRGPPAPLRAPCGRTPAPSTCQGARPQELLCKAAPWKH